MRRNRAAEAPRVPPNSANEVRPGKASRNADDDVVYVTTQDSQGNSVRTKATPVHIPQTSTNVNTMRKSCDGGATYSGRSTPYPADKATTRFMAKKAAEPRAMPPGQREKPDNSRERDSIKGRTVRSDTRRKEANDTRPTKDKRRSVSASPTRRNNDQQMRRREERCLTSDDEIYNDIKRRKIGGHEEQSTSKSAQYGADNNNEKDHKQTTSGKCDDLTSCSDDSYIDEHGNEKEKYSKVVSKYNWNKVSYKSEGSKKPDNQKKKGIPRLKGLFNESSMELVVKGIACEGFNSQKEIEKAVKMHCDENEIHVIYLRVLAYKSDRKSVNCKLVINEEDVSKVYSKGFWPKGVGIRDWFDKPNEKDRAQNSDKDSK